MATVRRLVTIDQAATELQVCPRTVRRYLARGILKGIRVGPRLIRINRDDLEKLISPVGAQ